MKQLVAICSLLIGFMLAVPCLAGHIQVKCEPGIQIYLDGELKGLSSSDVGGLILQDVLPGSHRLRAVKSGFTPREEMVTISGSEVKVWNIEKFVPQVRISQEGQTVQAKIEQKAGTLVIQTLPVEAKIEIPSLGINQSKDNDLLKFESVPEGEYDVRVSGIGKNLLYRVQITANGTSRLFFNLITGKAEDQDPERRRLTELSKKYSPGSKAIGTDGLFIAFDNGTVVDTKAGLMWAARDNGANINWSKAKSYCQNYSGGGYKDWRMPTRNELGRLYDRNIGYRPSCAMADSDKVHLTSLISLSCVGVWASDTRGSDAAVFVFRVGFDSWPHQSDNYNLRALPVRVSK